MTRMTRLTTLLVALVAFLAIPASGSQPRLEQLEPNRWRIVGSVRNLRTADAAERYAVRTSEAVCGLLGLSHMEIDDDSLSFRRGLRKHKARTLAPSRIAFEVVFHRESTEGSESCGSNAPTGEREVDRRVDQLQRLSLVVVVADH